MIRLAPPVRRWLWFVGLWGASVLALGVVAMLLRLLLAGLGQRAIGE